MFNLPTFIDLVVCERSSVSDLRSFLTTWRRKKKDQIVGDFMCFLNLYFYTLTLLFHGIATSRMFVKKKKTLFRPKNVFIFYFIFWLSKFLLLIMQPSVPLNSPTLARQSCGAFRGIRSLWDQMVFSCSSTPLLFIYLKLIISRLLEPEAGVKVLTSFKTEPRLKEGDLLRHGDHNS